jgi:Caspase domain
LLSQTGEIEVNVSADKMSQSMRDITLYANQLPVTKNAERQLKIDERDTFHRTFRFPAGSGDNLIRVEVNNGVSLGLAEQLLEASLKKTASPVKGNLYVLAVGVNKFDQRLSNSNVNVPDLSFADNDAVELAELLEKTKKTSEFNQVHIQVLSDSSDKQPTHQNILEALRVFEKAEPNDTVLLFLASHGFSDAKGNYYFMPKDGKFSEVEAVLTGNNLLEKPTSLLSWADFIDGMRSASGKRIMIVDTCRAKNIFGEFDAKSLRKRSAAALFPLLLASKGDESSQEYQPAQHGLFTYALLKGLSGLANTNHDKKVSLGELNEYIVPLVDKLHNPRLGSQTPQLIAPNALSEIGVSIYGD